MQWLVFEQERGVEDPMEKGGENRDTYSDENASQVPDFMMNRCELLILLSDLIFLQYIYETNVVLYKTKIYYVI